MVTSGWVVGRVVGGVVATALSIVAIPSAMSDPGAETDTQGFVDSTARCDPPNALIGFGNTTQSRVAICRTPNGQFEYRGVRVNDSAKLIAPAVYRNGAYIAGDDNNLYTVTMNALTVSRGSDIVSQESMINFYQPGTGGPSKEKTPS